MKTEKQGNKVRGTRLFEVSFEKLLNGCRVAKHYPGLGTCVRKALYSEKRNKPASLLEAALRPAKQRHYPGSSLEKGRSKTSSAIERPYVLDELSGISALQVLNSNFRLQVVINALDASTKRPNLTRRHVAPEDRGGGEISPVKQGQAASRGMMMWHSGERLPRIEGRR